MTKPASINSPYAQLLSSVRHRPSEVQGRSLELEADADRGRVLSSAPFRRLQNKAQVFSLESNAAVRSRLTHSLEVSSIGRLITQHAISSFTDNELSALGIRDNERALLTFVDTACLLHDLGNPPFGHFGEIAICDWFHEQKDLKPGEIGGPTEQKWNKYSADFKYFDGNPQGFRIVTKLQPREEIGDLFGLNLTATTLAATLKYPWNSDSIGEGYGADTRKKCGYFRTEEKVVKWVYESLGLLFGRRHPLVYLMEAADDIAYCVSDIEDGIEKGLVRAPAFAESMLKSLEDTQLLRSSEEDARKIINALYLLKTPVRERGGIKVERLTPMQDFRSAVIRYLAKRAGTAFYALHAKILDGTAPSLLSSTEGAVLLEGLKHFAETDLYGSVIVRNREITAQAVLSGLLAAYKSLMQCDKHRFEKALSGARRDDDGKPIAEDSSLIARISRKYLAVYKEEVRQLEADNRNDPGTVRVLEKIYRIRLIIDYIAGMTDEFAMQSFKLISGVEINPFRM